MRHPVRHVAMLLAVGAAAWSLPPRIWPLVCRAFQCRGFANESHVAANVRWVLGVSPAETERIVRDWVAYRREVKLQVLAHHCPWRTWSPELALHGRRHVDAALAKGRGAILWVDDFVASPLLTLMTLARADIAPAFLARGGHGFGASDFAVRRLNPIWRAAEDPFLFERVMIHGDETRPALARLREHLAANRVVMIMVGNMARRRLEIDFLSGILEVATGPAHLAHETGAPLLPAFTLRRGDGYATTIESQLPKGDHGETVRSHVKGLQRRVAMFPEQWGGWTYQVRVKTGAADSSMSPTR